VSKDTNRTDDVFLQHITKKTLLVMKSVGSDWLNEWCVLTFYCQNALNILTFILPGWVFKFQPMVYEKHII
jgi:hypothetical protein